jgi:hypothetical protein
MRQLLIGMAAIAALAILAPVRAQPASSTPSPSANTPPPPATSEAPSQMNRMPAGGGATSDRGMGTGSSTRAHHRRHAVQSARNPSSGSSADQLNREEVARFQSNNPSSMNRMPAGGRATSGTNQ